MWCNPFVYRCLLAIQPTTLQPHGWECFPIWQDNVYKYLYIDTYILYTLVVVVTPKGFNGVHGVLLRSEASRLLRVG